MKLEKGSYKHILLLLFSVMLVIALHSQMTLSYLISTKERDNVFGLGNVRLSLTETEFPEKEEDRILAPLGMIPKNPVVTNTGVNDAYVFLAVTVPYAAVTLVNDDNEIDSSGKINRELFRLLSDGAEPMTITDDQTAHFTVTETGNSTYDRKWVLIQAVEDQETATHTYYFGYSAMLVPSESTTALFDRLQLRNILEGELPDNITQAVVISAYGIQSEALLHQVTVQDTAQVTKTELVRIFELYATQEGRI